MLATASIGAIWSATSPDFGVTVIICHDNERLGHRLVILTDNQCGPSDSDTHCGGCVEEHRSQHCSGVDPSGNLGLVLGLESGLGVGVVLVLRLGSRLRLGVSVSDTAMSRQLLVTHCGP